MPSNKRTLIILSESEPCSLEDNYDLIIASDGGYRTSKKMEIDLDVLLGDFDSITREELIEAEKRGIKIFSFPREKDKTDGELAVDYAISQGSNELVILGSFKEELDHALGNLFLLFKLDKLGIKSKLLTQKYEIELIISEKEYVGKKGHELSLIPVSETVKDLNIEGSMYNLKDVNVEMGQTLTLRNIITEDNAKVYFKKGKVLSILKR
ncbi:MAG: Thiamin pyrophosphokinase, catalytic domain [Candidatus Methanofastidiosum methylothiophilum]|uniref:Thiamin pyrophosphokinase, catalytic domain n=1 Tax=Candidatus Methanofastidiosum methylothiophilum TaxID=1705564 RepID=A0A150IHY6_9EURY|nr:MAG: Thiamin pyrophosphokinase, catalytic domain [Candidatus Methanofastidiosum methylthiophilus]KYC46893.1 MAG: Thiamin pyrophosphokinase, catalytic domain [Candidatus Methanofastidiosum methylthiophilus]KYC49322.1 MAG: Thiamin pyrophosphokinase, catalytic domain [Candidatus Methanofastidiosum methylthiophilus]